MAPRVRVKTNFSFVKALEDLAPSESTMREQGTILRDRLEARALEGLDEDRRRFAPYAARTRALKQRRPRRNPFTGRYANRLLVTLHATGQMFRDLQVTRATRRTVQLGFTTRRSEQLAQWHESGAGRLPVRRFLGVPAAWLDDLVRALRRRL